MDGVVEALSNIQEAKAIGETDWPVPSLYRILKALHLNKTERGGSENWRGANHPPSGMKTYNAKITGQSTKGIKLNDLTKALLDARHTWLAAASMMCVHVSLFRHQNRSEVKHNVAICSIRQINTR